MINPSTISIDELLVEHPERKRWAPLWADYRLLYRGGDEFKVAAGEFRGERFSHNGATRFTPQTRAHLRRFLYQLDGEPDQKYLGRWTRAVYVNYLAAVVDYFAHWLFSVEPAIRPEGEGEAEPPEWFKALCLDADGAGHKLVDFMRDQFRESLITRYTGWLVAAPDLAVAGMTQADAEAAGLDGVRLTPYAAEDIVDWQEDASGELRWIVLRKLRLEREFPDARNQVETLIYLDREMWSAWELSTGPDEKQILEPVAAARHTAGAVPFVRLSLPFGLWVANKLGDWAVDLFNQGSMLSYGQLLGCFLQPYIMTHEGTGEAQGRVFGEGNLLHLRAGQGDRENEEFGWKVPDVTPLQFSAEQIAAKRDEGYRIVHQMSLAVDPQNASKAASSGLSKSEDRLPTEVILCGYGAIVRDAIRKTLDIASAAQGESVKWSVDGFDQFQVRSLMEEVETAALLGTVVKHSKTARAKIETDIALKAVGHVDEATRQAITDEIESGVEEEGEALTGIDPFAGQVPGANPPGSAVPPPPAPPTED